MMNDFILRGYFFVPRLRLTDLQWNPINEPFLKLLKNGQFLMLLPKVPKSSYRVLQESDQAKNIAAISGLVIPNLHFPVLFKRVDAFVWVIN